MFAPYIEKGARFAPGKMPIGNAIALILGVGISGGFNEVIKSFLPINVRRFGGIGSSLGLAYIFQNIGFFRRFLGDAGVDALSIGAIFSGVNSAFAVSDRVTGAISRLAPIRTAGPVATAGAPVKTAAPTGVETGAGQEQFEGSVDEKLRAILQVS